MNDVQERDEQELLKDLLNKGAQHFSIDQIAIDMQGVVDEWRDKELHKYRSWEAS